MSAMRAYKVFTAAAAALAAGSALFEAISEMERDSMAGTDEEIDDGSMLFSELWFLCRRGRVGAGASRFSSPFSMFKPTDSFLLANTGVVVQIFVSEGSLVAIVHKSSSRSDR